MSFWYIPLDQYQQLRKDVANTGLLLTLYNNIDRQATRMTTKKTQCQRRHHVCYIFNMSVNDIKQMNIQSASNRTLKEICDSVFANRRRQQWEPARECNCNNHIINTNEIHSQQFNISTINLQIYFRQQVDHYNNSTQFSTTRCNNLKGNVSCRSVFL